MALDLIARLRMIDNMTAPMRKVAGGLGSFAKNIAGVGGALAGLAAATGATKLATSSFGKALDFEAQMSTIKALTGASTATMEQMDELSLTMGAKTKYSALEAAKGIEELLKAGISPAAVQSGALDAALNLATAGGLELASAAEIMSTALNAYKKDGMTAAEASDILAGTANKSATEVEVLRQSLASVSAVAAGIGMTFKDTNVALGLFANNGIKGSDAGTSLKTMLQNLQPTTKDQITLFNRLGITTKGTANKFFTAGGKLQSLDIVTKTLHESLSGLNDMQRQAALEVMFGADAVRAGTVLYNEGEAGVKAFYKQLDEGTSAFDVATEKMNNGRGAIEQFHGAIETLQIRAIKPMLPAIKAAFTGLGDYVTAKTPQITAAVQRMTEKVSGYFKSHFTENPDFQKIPDITGKINFVIQDLLNMFDSWLKAGGSKQIEDMTSGMIGYISDALSNSSEKLTSIGVELGTSLAKGMLTGLEQFANDNPKLAALTTFMATPGNFLTKTIMATGVGTGISSNIINSVSEDYEKAKELIDVFKDEGFKAGVSNYIDGVKENFKKPLDPLDSPPTSFGSNGTWDSFSRNSASKPTSGSAGGLDRVPYNGYSARLHKDESVLTKHEADTYREGGSGKGNSGITISGNTFHVRQESDIPAIAMELARLISSAKEARSIG